MSKLQKVQMRQTETEKYIQHRNAVESALNDSGKQGND